MEGEQKYKTLNMCDFCSKELSSCGAAPVFAQEVDLNNVPAENKEAVIACDRYENPVDVLKKKFH